MSISRILIPILIIGLLFGLLGTLNGDANSGKVEGVIFDDQTGQPLEDVLIILKNSKLKTKTLADGSFGIDNVPPGNYMVSIIKTGFHEISLVRLSVDARMVTQFEVKMTPRKPGQKPQIMAIFASNIEQHRKMGGILKGKIFDKSSKADLTGASVQIDRTNIGAQTMHDGTFTVTGIPEGKHDILVRLVGYKTKTINDVEFKDGEVKTLQVALDETIIEAEGQIEFSENDLRELSRIRKGISPTSGCALMAAPISGQWLPHGGTTPPNNEPYSGTFFKHYGVNPFVDTEDDHFSTFAIDVDDASYSVARGYIERGNLPPADAVRSEEFINFFQYDYPAPETDRFRVYIEGAPSQFGQNCELVRIGIKGQEINPKDRKPAVLTFVIDVSGSMNIDTRLGLVKKALTILLDNLREDDMVGIAIYGSHGQKYLEHTSIKQKDKILHAIQSLNAGGSTYAEEGIKIGYKMASENFKKGAINRIILCSDGVANVGRTGADQILEEIKDYVKKGITLTTVGFGMDNYNDILMEQLGNKGNGHFAYVDNLQQARRIFMQNLTGTLQVIAKDVKIQVDFDPEKVRSYRLIGYENRDVADEDFRDDKVDGGEIGSGHDVTALYEVKPRDGAEGRLATVFVRFREPDDDEEVTEMSFPISKSDIKSEFASTSTDFRLAACAAEFAEILRESYWAKDGSLDDVLALAQEIAMEKSGNDDLIEFTAMVSRAKKLWDEKQLISSEDH